MSTKLFALFALSTLALARPSPTKTLPTKRQDAALPVNPFTCLNKNKLVGACCVTNENPDYTNFYCSAPTGTAVPGLAGAYLCPTKEDDRAVSSWCCSALDHGGLDDGYTLWCEDGVAGQLVDMTSLSLDGVEAALESPSTDTLSLAAVESTIAELENSLSLDTSALDDSALEQALDELESELSVDPTDVDVSALEEVIGEIESALSGTPLSTAELESAMAQLEAALAGSPLDASAIESAVAEVQSALAEAEAAISAA